jgi:hypothetical protein
MQYNIHNNKGYNIEIPLTRPPPASWAAFPILLLNEPPWIYPKDFGQLVSGFPAYGLCVMLHVGNFLFGYANPNRKRLLRYLVQPPVKAKGVSRRFFFLYFLVPVHIRYRHSFPFLKNRQGWAKIFF